MLQKISSEAFIKGLLLFAVIYYCLVLVAFYGKEIRNHLRNKARREPGPDPPTKE